ncbi:sel1 repeat family protein [Fertoebacter nigrum]|uniref:Sel1 repeat family protein n=1 Tax=Fertoeibacter niger TaxID=2656921 RepID=A0A8X8KM47_9RHOB|nr:tetratricopeptide repeat protein [Fertoeibacter niger]NUB43535.1 sel1 repeat family protein [Fertoeibacter niger]
MRHIALALLLAVVAPGPALAETTQPDTEGGGTLNPDEMGMGRMMENAARGETSMTTCASGYMMTKSGQHAAARALFQRCAADGYTGAMTWMGHLDNNGLGADADPDRAAEWDRQAAEAGDPVGLFNYGLAQLRGHGVRQDLAEGRRLVDRAAAMGLPVARRLQGAGYDPDEVTPDADNWKYAPLF